MLALWWAYPYRGHRVLIVSAAEDASRRLLAVAAALATRSPLLSASVVDENSGPLRLSNGTEILSVPASERAIGGLSVDLLLVNEAAQVEDDLLLGAAIPTTAARPEARVAELRAKLDTLDAPDRRSDPSHFIDAVEQLRPGPAPEIESDVTIYDARGAPWVSLMVGLERSGAVRSGRRYAS